MRRWLTAVLAALLLCGAAVAADDIVALERADLTKRIAGVVALRQALDETVKAPSVGGKNVADLKTDLKAQALTYQAEAMAGKTAEQELAEIDAFLTAREEAEAKYKWAAYSVIERRAPSSLRQQYERHKHDTVNRRWREWPTIPTRPWHEWHLNGKSYQSQLRDKRSGQFINPGGFTDIVRDPLTPMEDWQFLFERILPDRPTIGKAHLLDRRRHDEVSADDYRTLMTTYFPASLLPLAVPTE